MHAVLPYALFDAMLAISIDATEFELAPIASYQRITF